MRAYNAFKVGSREITNGHQFQVYLESNLLETKKVECIYFCASSESQGFERIYFLQK